MKTTTYLKRMAACSGLFDDSGCLLKYAEMSEDVQSLITAAAIFNESAALEDHAIDLQPLLDSWRKSSAAWDAAKEAVAAWFAAGLSSDPAEITVGILAAGSAISEMTAHTEEVTRAITAAADQQPDLMPTDLAQGRINNTVSLGYDIMGDLDKMAAQIEQDA